MYAVIELQGHQYIVSKGVEIVVDKMDAEEGKNIKVATVLAVFDEEGKDVSIGKPYVDGATVTVTVNTHQKGDKIHVIKFKRKNRYKRKIGFRPHQSVLTVKNIQLNG